MRLSIRWKLILSIVVPMLIIATVVMWFTFDRINRFAIQRIQTLVTEQAGYYAARLDDRFTRLAQVATSTARVIETIPELDEDTIYELLRANLEEDPLIFGSAMAFEPHAYQPERRLFSPYVYRRGDDIAEMDIGVSAYDYTQPERGWFSETRNRRMARWSGPYFDEGAGNVLMNTYAVPFFHDGEFAGVATIDVSLDRLSERIDIGNINEYPYIIVNASGRFIVHPLPEMVWKSNLSHRAEEIANPVLNDFAGKLIQGQRGVIEVSGPAVFQSDEVFWIFYAPLRQPAGHLPCRFPRLKSWVFSCHRSTAVFSVSC
ncbi:MAG: hypothetical protein MI673_06705 [Thiotrichales bacterium]|nr:hypothetical protein [Thiotrichales bacterium]